MEKLILELKEIGILIEVCSGCGKQCNGNCPAGTHLEINHKIIDQRILLMDFMAWYCGDEHNNLPDDAKEIVEIYCKKIP